VKTWISGGEENMVKECCLKEFSLFFVVHKLGSLTVREGKDKGFNLFTIHHLAQKNTSYAISTSVIISGTCNAAEWCGMMIKWQFKKSKVQRSTNREDALLNDVE